MVNAKTPDVRPFRHLAHALWFTTLTILLWCTRAHGASLHVDPVTFTLLPTDRSAVLQLVNADDAPVRVQISVVKWGLDGDGHQVETPTTDLILNPPIASLEAHQAQFIRFGPRVPMAAGEERSYRIVIEEVPDPVASTASGMRTVLRISLPVFFADASDRPNVVWSLATSAAGTVVSARNDGNAHVRITRLALPAGTRPAPAELSKTPVYLLPHESHEWPLPAEAAGSPLSTLLVRTDRQERDDVVQLSRPSP